MREFKFYAEIPDGKGFFFHELIEELTLDHYPDSIDIAYCKTLALDLYPDCTFIQVFELAEEVVLHKDKKK